MSLADIGSLGEAVSAIAVLVTLIYLAYQTKQNTKLLQQSYRAQTAHMASANVDQSLMILSDLMTNPGLAQIAEKLRTRQDVREEDIPVAYAFFDAWFLRMENLVTQRSLSGFDASTVDNVVSGQIRAFQKHPVFVSWWETRKSGSYSVRFSMFMDKVVNSDGI